ncbi:MAG: sulfotransferase [Chitinophagales bacterium]|nr:sulfotransferase [Chitinophagales bacterium]
MAEKLPNFFIVGAPKAGTTSLYYYLKRHPEVYMSPIKEPNFFSYEDTIRQNLYHKEKGVGTFQEYKKLFEQANGHHKAIGEASVSYLFYPTVAEKIHQLVPDAKIIMSLRNPIERAFSHFFMEHKLGYVNVPLEDIVSGKCKHKFAHLWYQQYVELGLYSTQVKRYFDAFGRDNVRIYIYDEISENIEGMILNVFDFLQIDKTFIPGLEGKYNTYSTPRNSFFRAIYSQKNLRTLARKFIPDEKVESIKNLFLTRKKKALKHDKTVERMNEIFKPDIMELEKLLNKNLSAWYE